MNSISIYCAAVSTANMTVTEGDGGNRLVATSNGSLSMDGVAPSLNDLVLLKDQSDKTQNGLFTVAVVGDGSNPYELQRINNGTSIVKGLLMVAGAGTTNENVLFVAKDNLIEVGTSELNFAAIVALVI